MPIKPENKARYPKDWKDVRHRIMRRANWRCEHPGCRARHGVTGYWRKGLFHRLPDVLWDAGYTAGDTVACENGEKLKVIKIVLTIAHLDHTPENCADDNLRAWCQRHHLAYDAEHHKQTAYATRKQRANTVDLFERAAQTTEPAGGTASRCCGHGCCSAPSPEYNHQRRHPS